MTPGRGERLQGADNGYVLRDTMGKFLAAAHAVRPPQTVGAARAAPSTLCRIDGAVRSALRSLHGVMAPLLLEAMADVARIHQSSIGMQVQPRSYFDTDFLNMRSIFSLICSIACEFC
jgi:hypothetical protein